LWITFSILPTYPDSWPELVATLTELLSFALDVTGPILLILALGPLLRKTKLVDNHFVLVGNRLVFNVTLPCMLFFGIANRPLQQALDIPMVVFASLATVSVTLVLWLIAPLFVGPEKRGVFVQGAFRGNLAIIGIAWIMNAYGPVTVAKAGVYIGLMTILYNVLSVLVLRSRAQSYFSALFTNPLVVAILLGMLVSALGIPILRLVVQTGQYIGQMTLPLALLCIGSSLRWGSFKANHLKVIWASAFKLVVIPVIVTLAAIAAGFRGPDLGLLFLMTASPTAAASYVMAKQMTNYGAMAAEIVAVTTVFSAVTVTIGLIVLKGGGFI